MSKLEKKIRRNFSALEIAEKRWAKFQACKHTDVQDYTECCLSGCGENIYITKEEMIREARAELKNQEQAEEEKNWTNW